MVQLSHPYMTTGKIIALTRRTFANKVMSLLFNMLSMLVITFLPRSKRLLISWLQSSSAVILEPRKIKSATVSTSICYEVMGPDAMILVTLFNYLTYLPYLGNHKLVWLCTRYFLSPSGMLTTVVFRYPWENGSRTPSIPKSMDSNAPCIKWCNICI